jgi:hypothetical protein
MKYDYFVSTTMIRYDNNVAMIIYDRWDMKTDKIDETWW